MGKNDTLDTTQIQKGDLVRFKTSEEGWKVLYETSTPVSARKARERLYYYESWRYKESDWFEVTAPFKGVDLLTVKFAKIPGEKPPPTRKSLEASKSFILEIKRPEKAPVYKKQLALF